MSIMMLLGKKIGMTQVYNEAGRIVPVTVLLLGPCTITQLKTIEIDGYAAIQLGYDDVKKSRRKKPAIGHAKKGKELPKKIVKECRVEDSQESYNVGDEITVENFSEIKSVDVTGTSKGKGFAGTMKRHGFGGFPASHGTERKHRAPGSISSFASDAGSGGNLKKGKKMAGQMGNVKVTSRNHSIISIDNEKNLLVVKGAIAGPAGGYVAVRPSKTNK